MAAYADGLALELGGEAIVPDRLRKVPSFATLAKPLFQLDLIKMTVSLTVSDTVARQNAWRDNDLADQLMTEWE